MNSGPPSRKLLTEPVRLPRTPMATRAKTTIATLIQIKKIWESLMTQMRNVST